jgi:hypothetical protein
MLQSKDQTYADYVAGYSQTQRIVPYLGRGGAAAGSTYITTVLLGYQTDGTVETYYGFFQLASGQNYALPLDGWVLVRGSFQLVKDGTAPHNATIASLISSEWQENITLPPEIASLGEMSTDEADTILDYYDWVNQRDYNTAYNQWLTPAHGLVRDYRPPFNQFSNGYSDTAYVMVYAGQTQGIPVEQQRSYLNSYLPTVLVGHHWDGSFVTYSGCYALGNLYAGEQGIVNGRFRLLTNSLPDAATLFNALNGLNCAALGMGI